MSSFAGLGASDAAVFGGDISRSELLDFVDNGGNLLIALAPGASDAVRSLASDCGVEPDARGGAQAVDHFSFQAAGGAADASLVAISSWVDSDAILGAARPAAPVLFRGVAASVPTSSELVSRSGGRAVDVLVREGRVGDSEPKK